MHAAALPRGPEHLHHGGLEPLVGVGHDQLHPGQAAAPQGAEEVQPERFRLGTAHRHVKDLAAAVGVHPNGDGDGHRHDPPGLPHLHVGRVQPEVGPIALDRARQEIPHPLVDLGAEPGHPAFADALHAHRADEVVHRARRDAMDVSLLDHRRQRLLRGAARLQERREVRAAPEPRDAQLHGARPGLPVPIPVAVALHQAVRRALTRRGPGQFDHFQLHQPLRGEADHLPQERRVRTFRQHLAKGSLVFGHRGRSEVGVAGPATQPWPGPPR
jgi:hypothetical protein